MNNNIVVRVFLVFALLFVPLALSGCSIQGTKIYGTGVAGNGTSVSDCPIGAHCLSWPYFTGGILNVTMTETTGRLMYEFD